jgi:hypothetical protein
METFCTSDLERNVTHTRVSQSCAGLPPLCFSAQLEAQLRIKEQEAGKLSKQLERAQGGEHEASADRSKAQEAVHK